MPIQPLCFVVMPFGKKKDPSRPRKPEIDFNAIYESAIEPGIRDAGLKAKRADNEETGGIIHKPMFEDLLLCDYVVADLTIPNANVYYELGIRHAARHNTTLPIAAQHSTAPFDVGPVRSLRYKMGADNSFSPEQANELRAMLGARLKQLRELSRVADAPDSPVFQLIEKSQQSSLPVDSRLRRIKETDTALFELLNRYSGHEKTDIFREYVEYSDQRRKQLQQARNAGSVEQLNLIRDELQPFDTVEAGVIVDLYLSYRATKAWEEMINLYRDMPEVLKRTVLVREQLAFALNRRAKDPAHRECRDEAIKILEEVLTRIGPSSETYGLLGRIYKDKWEDSIDRPEGAGSLRQAIAAYAAGFEADWRDAYPGINAVTLLDIEGSQESVAKKDRLVPVVRFAAERRLAGKPDYWDYATLVEIAVLERNEAEAKKRLEDALANVRESWEPETTARNLRLIREAREKHQTAPGWAKEIEEMLLQKAASLRG
ncbi:MAG TPA: TRAFs-binding domain-containing protein [Bryobacteraceae bacterium]|nr:TRAFs-binding domain-containing protein [Bryobacteraceae bacterium]